MKIEILIPGFSGFYQGIWDQQENEFMERQSMKEKVHTLNFLDDWEFAKDYRDQVAKLFADEYVCMVNKTLGYNWQLINAIVDSPREYNFTTDKIYAYVEIGDGKKFINKLICQVTDPMYYSKIAEQIRCNHTSYAGFWSWMSNDIEDWFKEIESDNWDLYVDCLIGYLIEAKDPGWAKYLNEALCNYAYETELHILEPTTYKAQEEWELYQKYGKLYTRFVEEHPIRIPDAYRPGYTKELNWDNYKASFMDVVEAHEKEQKRKAAIAAHPTIPGL